MAAASEGRVVRRIIDYLNDGEELGIEGTAEKPPPVAAAARLSLPRFRWPRLARKGGCAKEKTVFVAGNSEQVPNAVSTSALEQVPRKCEPASTCGARRCDLGVGLSLVFLLAKTSDEFNRMVNVRADMEALLEEVKLHARETNGAANVRDGLPGRPREDPESATSSCVTDRNGRIASAHVEEQAAISSGTDAAGTEESSEDDETPPLLFLDSEPSDDMDDYRPEDDDQSWEVVQDRDDVVDDDYETEYNGVSAVELERRLHELLHERDREQIEKLEAALRRAEKKLAEKEMEVCLWKDTAKFALGQDNASQGVSRLHLGQTRTLWRWITFAAQFVSSRLYYMISSKRERLGK